MKNIGEILLIIGFLISSISGILSWICARNDDNIDKEDIMWHTYIFAYPLYAVLMIFGVILIVIGNWLAGA